MQHPPTMMMKMKNFTFIYLFVFIVFCVQLKAFPTTISEEDSSSVETSSSTFSCDGRTSGYYADVTTGCQIYHMCDSQRGQFSYKCPKKTLFQQRMLICDHWYMVNCSKSEQDFSANLLIGQVGRFFIENDSPFDRTPRPDLNNQQQQKVTTSENNQPKKQQKFYKTNYVTTTAAAAPSEQQQQQQTVTQVYLSNFKATVPSFPKIVAIPADKLSEFDQTVNFPSNFQATTPQYPLTVPATSPDPNLVGIQGPSSSSSFLGIEKRIDNSAAAATVMDNLGELKRHWLIPDYEFPLDDDSVARPSYNNN